MSYTNLSDTLGLHPTLQQLQLMRFYGDHRQHKMFAVEQSKKLKWTDNFSSSKKYGPEQDSTAASTVTTDTEECKRLKYTAWSIGQLSIVCCSCRFLVVYAKTHQHYFQTLAAAITGELWSTQFLIQQLYVIKCCQCNNHGTHYPLSQGCFICTASRQLFCLLALQLFEVMRSSLQSKQTITQLLLMYSECSTNSSDIVP